MQKEDSLYANVESKSGFVDKLNNLSVLNWVLLSLNVVVFCFIILIFIFGVPRGVEDVTQDVVDVVEDLGIVDDSGSDDFDVENIGNVNPIANASDDTVIRRNSGGGGMTTLGAGPSCSPSLNCSDYIGQCGTDLSDGCFDILNCSTNCNETETCYTGNGTNNPICIPQEEQCTAGSANHTRLGYFKSFCEVEDLTEYFCWCNETTKVTEVRNRTRRCDYGCENFDVSLTGKALCRGRQCSADSDCDDGRYCNGEESCNNGRCVTGSRVDCNDGVSCTMDRCNEVRDMCVRIANDSACDPGEVCDVERGCVEEVPKIKEKSCLTCGDFNSICGASFCNSSDNKCYIDYNLTTDVCRTSAGECDLADYCSGSSINCVNSYVSGGTVCSTGICDGNGNCVECISNLDCDDGGACLNNVCRSDELINPVTDFEYLGAFMVPSFHYTNTYKMAYGGYGLGYYPNGDPDGGEDGFSGSLFITGFSQGHGTPVAEIDIPTPIVSASKSTGDLPRSKLLQNFTDVTNGSQYSYVAVRDIEYLEAIPGQTEDKLYWAMYDYYVPQENYMSGRSNLDFSNLEVDGNWKISDAPLGSIGEYLFQIPKDWADTYVDGKYLANGRCRPGQGGGSYGPSLFAISPYEQGDPPINATVLDAVKLLYYPSDKPWDVTKSWGDYWYGGSWLTKGSKHAVVFPGRKAIRDDLNGLEYYGKPLLDHQGAQGGKGYYSNPYHYAMLFYDPSDLADVALGIKENYEVKPYAIFNPSKYTIRPDYDSERMLFGGAAYDRERGLLYISQVHVEQLYARRPVIHVFKINEGSGGFENNPPSAPENLVVDDITESSVTMSWNPIIDESDGETYLVYRNFYPREIVFEESYTDTEVSPGINYIYSVSAINIMNNHGPQSLPVVATTLEGVDTKVPYVIYKRIKNITSNSAIIEFKTDEPATSKVIFNGAVMEDLTLKTFHEFKLEGLLPSSSISYTLNATDSSGNELEWVDSLARFYTLHNKPIGNLAPTFDNVQDIIIEYGQSIELQIVATDPEGKRMSFMIFDEPEGSIFNAGTHPYLPPNYTWFLWTPRADQVGTHEVTFHVSDGDKTDSKTITIEVTGTPVQKVSCSQCGNGFFNLCDRTECNTLSEGCYFIDNLLVNDCNSCSGASCSSYDDDQTTCTSDVCGLGNCGFSEGSCDVLDVPSEICTDQLGLDYFTKDYADNGTRFLDKCSDSNILTEYYCDSLIDSPSDYISFWKFDGDTSDEKNINPGTLGGDSKYVIGKSGQAIEFDGLNDNVVIPGSSLNFSENDFTVSLWAKEYDHSTHGWILGKRRHFYNKGWHLYAYSTTRALRVEINNGSTTFTLTSDPTKLLEKDSWHNILVKINRSDASDSSIYYDGLDITRFRTGTMPSGSIESAYDFKIGESGHGGYDFNGSVDELIVFDRALSDDEIQEIFCSQGGTADFCADISGELTGDVSKSVISCEGSCLDGACEYIPCTNDTGCSSAGNFCNGQTPYSCSLGIDGCLDRVNLAACTGDDICSKGKCVEVAECTVSDDCNAGEICHKDACTTITNDIYYVSPSGSNSNDGSINTPWQTIDYAFGQTKPGDTVYLREGVYEGKLVLDCRYGEGGAEGAWFTFSGYPGEDAIIKSKFSLQECKYSHIKNIHFVDSLLSFYRSPNGGSVYNEYIKLTDNYITGKQVSYGQVIVTGSNHLIENNTIYFENGGGGSLDHGIYLAEGENNIVRGNYVNNASGYGIHLYVRAFSDPHGHVIRNATIENNIVANSRYGSGFVVASGRAPASENRTAAVDGVIFRNNIAYNNKAGGITIPGAGNFTKNIKIYNNIFYENNSGLQIGMNYRDSTNWKLGPIDFRNNIVISKNPGRWQAFVGPNVTGFTESNNIYWYGTERLVGFTKDATSKFADPMFVDPENHDFRLQAGSPAIDAGVSLSEVSEDYYGVSRPLDGDNDGTASYDIGVEEVEAPFVSLIKKSDLEYLGMVRTPTKTNSEFSSISDMQIAKRDDNSFFASLNYGVGILTLPSEPLAMTIENSPVASWTVPPKDIGGEDWADQYLSYINITRRYNNLRLEGLCVAHDGRLTINYAKFYETTNSHRNSVGFINSDLDISTVEGYYGSNETDARLVEGYITPAPDGKYFRGPYWGRSLAMGAYVSELTLPYQEEEVLSFVGRDREKDWTRKDWYRDAELIEYKGQKVLLFPVLKGTSPEWYGGKYADHANDPNWDGSVNNSHNLPGDPRIDLRDMSKGYHAYPYKVKLMGYEIESWEKVIDIDLSEYMLLGDRQKPESIAFIGDTLWIAESRADEYSETYTHPHVLHAFRIPGVKSGPEIFEPVQEGGLISLMVNFVVDTVVAVVGGVEEFIFGEDLEPEVPEELVNDSVDENTEVPEENVSDLVVDPVEEVVEDSVDPIVNVSNETDLVNVSLECIDVDGDGYNVSLGGCGDGDCDDGDVDVNPGVEEVCGNGVDDNCDGIDEACVDDEREEVVEEVINLIPEDYLNYWKFEGDVGGGTISGNPNFGNGISGQAMEFDGVDDSINFGEIPGIVQTDALTVLFWIKSTTDGSSKIPLGIGSPNGCMGSWDFTTSYNGRTYFEIIADECGRANFISSNAYDGTWHQIVGSYDGSKVKLYLDGTLQDEGETTGLIKPMPYGKTFQIGSLQGYTYFDGSIDEVLIYNRALTPEEINNIYCSQKGIC
jgi:hypothetical protein